MRAGGIIGAIIVIWLLLGVYSVWHKGFFDTGTNSCAGGLTVALTVIAGPLNFVEGLSPHVTQCPEPK
ncbi:MAG: hypothetical protein ACRDTV_22365 [Mycobacterium sp.]